VPVVVRGLTLLPLLFLPGAPTRGQIGTATDPDAVRRELAEKLSTLWNSWRSVEIETERRQSFGNAEQYPGPTAERVRLRYIETAQGQRFLELRGTLTDGTETRSASYCDGERCAMVSYDREDPSKPTQILISESFAGEQIGLNAKRPLPLRFFDVALVPLHEALEDARLVGEDRVAGRDCALFLFEDVPQAIGDVWLRYALDRETGIPLAVDGYRDATAYQEDRPYRSWRVTEVQRFDGRLLPARAVNRGIDDATQRETSSSRAEVLRVEFNKDYPKSTFWPTPEPGVRIVDNIEGTITQEPGGETEPAPAQNPVRADSAPGPSLLPRLVVATGLVLVIAAAYLTWKARQS